MSISKSMTGYAFVLAYLLVVVFSVPATATPYASGIQVNGSNSTFILNEDADNVTIVYDESPDVNLGALTAGIHTFNATGTWQIVCSKSTAEGWTQISDDSKPENQFYSPKGVSVNKNVGSPNFGRIYVANALPGTVTAVPSGRETDTGLYVLGADSSDILNQLGDAYSGGVPWDNNTEGDNPQGPFSPFRISVAPDDSVYIADWSNTNPGVWRSSADPQTTFDNILENLIVDTNTGLCLNHGSIPSVWVEGTGADTKLYTLDEDFDLGGTTGSVLRYDIGTATEYAYAPVEQTQDLPNNIVNLRADLVRDEDGSWWIQQYRWTEGSAYPALARFEDGGTGLVYHSHLDEGLDPLLVSYGGIDIHNELDLIVMGAGGGNGIYIIDISDPNNLILLDTISQQGYQQEVSFDAAGNVYAVNTTTETLRIFSPGGDWTTKTGSDGTFILERGVSPIDSADFDGDGDVDGADFLAWQLGFGIDSGATLADGDANGDGAVNDADLTIWKAQFGTTSGNLIGTPIPEPSSILLVLAGLACLGCYRCRAG